MAQKYQMAQFLKFFMLKIIFSTQFCMGKATTTDDLRKVMACLGTLGCSAKRKIAWTGHIIAMFALRITLGFFYEQFQKRGGGRPRRGHPNKAQESRF